MTRDNAVWRAPFMKDGSVSKVGRFCSTVRAERPRRHDHGQRGPAVRRRMPRSAMSSCSRRTANGSPASSPAPAKAAPMSRSAARTATGSTSQVGDRHRAGGGYQRALKLACDFRCLGTDAIAVTYVRIARSFCVMTDWGRFKGTSTTTLRLKSATRRLGRARRSCAQQKFGSAGLEVHRDRAGHLVSRPRRPQGAPSRRCAAASSSA